MAINELVNEILLSTEEENRIISTNQKPYCVTLISETVAERLQNYIWSIHFCHI